MLLITMLWFYLKIQYQYPFWAFEADFYKLIVDAENKMMCFDYY